MGNAQKIVAVGAKVPAFKLPVTGGRTVRLSHFQSGYLVMYFYPRDNTPGCTTESREFAAAFDEFENLSASILGVSQDSLASHEKFLAKLELPFDLGSDEDGSLCRLFDCLKLKKMYGKEFIGIERSTFLIGPKGKLLREWRKVRVPGHVDEVLQTLREIQST